MEFIEALNKFNEMCMNYQKCSDCPMKKLREEYEIYICENLIINHPVPFLEVVENWTKPNTIDWSKVAVDTPVIVYQKYFGYKNRYFAKYEDGVVYTWRYGATSWTTSITEGWNKSDVKLAEMESVDEKNKQE